MITRILDAGDLTARTCFLWGPRQTGKSTWLRELFPAASYYDLLQAKELRRLVADPGILAAELSTLGWKRGRQTHPVVIDEIQKLPELLDEVHSLTSRFGWKFILTGSSPRKLLRGGGNLLGGRAIRRELFPLVNAEIPAFDLERELNHGLLPPYYLADDPRELIERARVRFLLAVDHQQRFVDLLGVYNRQRTLELSEL